ncbi:hypothetical protein NMG60_11016503 [Bertholletia excelsa]
MEKLCVRRERIANYFKEMALTDDQEHAMVLRSLWRIAMTQPDNPDFPSRGIFDCMVNLIYKSLNDRNWLLRGQNIYVPYYAAHIIGSYTMNKAEFAEKAILAGVIPPLMELLGGKMSWVEQRVAVRALGHLASYESTFEAVTVYEEQLVTLAMNLSSTCIEVVYNMFVRLEKRKRQKYHSDLLTRGAGGSEVEDRKAEEWASQLQYWSLYLLNSFAIKGRSISLMCNQEFLKELCEMWGGLVKNNSPAGVGLIRILCYTEIGRKRIAESDEVVGKLCNLSKSSDDWQYVGIDCLLLLLNDPGSRAKAIEASTLCLVDLIELRALGGRSNVGEAIARSLLLDFQREISKIRNNRVKAALEEIWDLKVDRRKSDQRLSEEDIEQKRVLMSLVKQEGNKRFWSGQIEEAMLKYTEGLGLCPLRLREERIVLYSNRAQCHLLLRDPDAAISDATRALSLSTPANSHGKSLWRRSQAYDMKGMAKESLMDCIMFVNGWIKSNTTENVKIPYYAARMISKQMDSTWLFANARSKTLSNHADKEQQSDGDNDLSENERENDDLMRLIAKRKCFTSGLSTIVEERRSREGGRGRTKPKRSEGRKETDSWYYAESQKRAIRESSM